MENVIALGLEVLLHKAVLTTTVPQGKYKVAEEANSLLVDINREGDLVGVACQVVCKNNTSHGSLACSHAAHQEHFRDVFLCTILHGSAILHHSL